VVFNKTYYGYSTYPHREGLALAKYLAMVLGSKPALWFALMTSGEFGFERDVVEKATIDRTFVPLFEAFAATDRHRMEGLFASLTKNPNVGWEEVDAWVAQLYGLKPRDLDVISDTLKYSLPFAYNKKSAQSVPTVEAIRLFCATLGAELAEWAGRFGKRLSAEQAPLPRASPWRALKLHVLNGGQEGKSTTEERWFEFFKVADQQAASETIFEDPAAKCIWIGRLDQARYWTRTRARLVARQMIWEHPEFLSAGAR
jgi:hypothetical protein